MKTRSRPALALLRLRCFCLHHLVHRKLARHTANETTSTAAVSGDAGDIVPASAQASHVEPAIVGLEKYRGRFRTTCVETGAR